jgi:hypothetical protein
VKNNCNTISAIQRGRELKGRGKMKGLRKWYKKLWEEGKERRFVTKVCEREKGQRKFWKYEEFEMFYW